MDDSHAFPIFECQIEQRIKSAIFLVFVYYTMIPYNTVWHIALKPAEKYLGYHENCTEYPLPSMMLQNS